MNAGAGPDLSMARQVADAVLYEGYVLYPYRASSAKNQSRWQFGVLTPRDWSEGGGNEPWYSQTEMLIEPGAGCALHLTLRFLQVQAKTVSILVDGSFQPVSSLELDGDVHVSWDEGFAQEFETDVSLDDILGDELNVPFVIPGAVESEPLRNAAGEKVGCVERRRWRLAGILRICATRPEGPYGVVRVRITVENLTPWTEPIGDRDVAVRRSLVAAHSLAALRDGVFISLLDYPEWSKGLVTACENVNTWPVMVGDAGRRDQMLSSPIILYDFPRIAAESPGELYDGTEIDEILTLRTMALTDGEKREARATDPRAAAILDRVDHLPPEIMERLHGAMRDVPTLTTPTEDADGTSEILPWWDPGRDDTVAPETDSVEVDGVPVAAGARVRLRPGIRRSDAQDMFLTGRIASVESVFKDVDGRVYLAILPEDDPAAELMRWQKRYIFFAPDEVELVEAAP